jgi:uncharacterized membrane protein
MESLLERRLESVEGRLERIERALGLVGDAQPLPRAESSAVAVAAQPIAVPQPSRHVEQARWDRDRLAWEDLVGGRLFAWLGGIAVVIGAAFFVGMAINRGWIGVQARMALAGGGSSALLVLGMWLHERAGRTRAARSAVSAALAAQYATLIATTLLYGLVDDRVGLVLAAAVGATGVALAVRWRSPVLGGVGMLGALLAPVLVGAGTSNVSLAFVAIALVAVTTVLLRERWSWLALCSFGVTAPQLPLWIHSLHHQHLLASVVVLIGFSALFLVSAIGHALRCDERLSFAAMTVAFLDIALTAGTGWEVLRSAGHHDAADAWLLAAAAIHVAVAFALTRRARDVAAVIGALGLAQSAVGFALVLRGPPVVVVWAAHAVALSWLARIRDEREPLVPAAVFLAGAVVHAIGVEAPPVDLVNRADRIGEAAVALAIVAAAATACAWLLREHERAGLLGWVAGAALVYLASIAVVDRAGAGQPGQIALSALWSVAGLGLLVFGLVRDARSLRSGGVALLCLAVTKVFVYDLSRLASGYRVVSFLALGMLLLMGAFAYQRKRRLD